MLDPCTLDAARVEPDQLVIGCSVQDGAQLPVGLRDRARVNAALVYQRRTASRDRAIADSLDAMVAALKAEGSDGSGHVGGTMTG
jgi:hypothetical protein